MMSTDMISITELSSERVKLVMKIGKSRATTINLKKQMLPSFINNSIKSRLAYYVNHREQVLCKHGGYLTSEKAAALYKLKLMLGSQERWTLLATARQIMAYKQELICIMPGTSSKFFTSNSALLQDLVYWAEQTVFEHEDYYGNRN